MFRLVFVDDEPWALSGMTTIIPWENYGFAISACCSTGEEALEAIRQYRPHAVFTDIRMPNMSGMDLISATKDSNIPVEFVITSAYSDFEVARKAIRFGAYHYLLKPLDQQEVQEVAQRLQRTLAQKSKPPIKPVDIAQPLSEQVIAFLTQAAQNGYCYLAMTEQENPLNLPEGASLTPIVLTQHPVTYLISAQEPLFSSALGCDIYLSHKHGGFLHLSQMAQEARCALEGRFQYAPHKTVAAIQFYIGNHYGDDLSIKDLSKNFFLSEVYLCELFKKYTGKTISFFLKEVRIQHAKRLLLRSDLGLRTIAEQVGYLDYSYFGRLFKGFVGLTPDQYRKKDSNLQLMTMR